MTKPTDVREALHREASRVKSALSDFASLAGPRKKRFAAPEAEPAQAFLPPSEFVPPAATAPRAGRPIELEPSESLGDWFNDDEQPAVSTPDNANDFFGSDDGWQHASNPSVHSAPDFSPGSGDDFSEGFESELNVPAKTGQDTLSVPAIAATENTPADGMPQPQEAINDVLDGFDW
jgi:hypothetical protein